MKKNSLSIKILWFTTAAIMATTCTNAEASGLMTATGATYEKFIKGKLSIGTRLVHRTLTDSDSGHKGGTYESGTYLGTIYALEEEQSYIPNKLFIKYDFIEYLGVELAWDSMEANTLATLFLTDITKSDGTVTLYGPTISIVGQLPNKTEFTPYVGLGIGLFSADFDESADWQLGYQSPTQYESMGSPSTPLNNHTREMDVDSTTAFIMSLGVNWAFDDNWFADLSGQYIAADPNVTFYSYTNGVQDAPPQYGHFPMDNITLRVGIGYRF